MAQRSGLQVSYELIYPALYALPRGQLRRELLSYLRQAKPMRGRKPKGSERCGKLVGMTNIKERPEEVEGRLVPGHWEGDLILGIGGASAIGTLVERITRFVVLVHMATRRADVAASACQWRLNSPQKWRTKTPQFVSGPPLATRAPSCWPLPLAGDCGVWASHLVGGCVVWPAATGRRVGACDSWSLRCARPRRGGAAGPAKPWQ